MGETNGKLKLSELARIGIAETGPHTRSLVAQAGPGSRFAFNTCFLGAACYGFDKARLTKSLRWSQASFTFLDQVLERCGVNEYQFVSPIFYDVPEIVATTRFNVYLMQELAIPYSLPEVITILNDYEGVSRERIAQILAERGY